MAAFQPTDHRWKPLLELCRDRGAGVVCVQLLVHPGREAENFTRARSDFKDATIIGRLAAELRYLPYALEDDGADCATSARVGGVGRHLRPLPPGA